MKMRTRKIFSSVFALLIIATLASCSPTANAASRTTAQLWEYYVLAISQYTRVRIIERMNELGEEGWELVATGTFLGGGGYPGLYFKRPLP